MENLAAASAPSPAAAPALEVPADADLIERAGRTEQTEGAAPADQADHQALDDEAARRAFSASILISATRCLLTYIVLPFIAPALGIAADVGPGLGIAIGLVAIGSNVLTIRRFHRADHRWRWGYTAIAVAVIVMLGILMVEDIVTLVT